MLKDYWKYTESTPESDSEGAIKARCIGLPENDIKQMFPLDNAEDETKWTTRLLAEGNSPEWVRSVTPLARHG